MAAAGLSLTVLLAVGFALVWGRDALVPALTFGLLATLIQVAAERFVRSALDGPFTKLMAHWGLGMGLRLAGVGGIVFAVLARRDLYPPLPTAFAYLGVLIPLLFFEARLFR